MSPHEANVSSLVTLLTGETEAFLLPVLRLVDSCADDFLHQILRVSPVYTVSVFNGSVCHDTIILAWRK